MKNRITKKELEYIDKAYSRGYDKGWEIGEKNLTNVLFGIVGILLISTVLFFVTKEPLRGLANKQTEEKNYVNNWTDKFCKEQGYDSSFIIEGGVFVDTYHCVKNKRIVDLKIIKDKDQIKGAYFEK